MNFKKATPSRILCLIIVGSAFAVTYHSLNCVSGMRVQNINYYFRRNIFGDILEVWCQNQIRHVSYTYTAWGVPTITNHSGTNIASLNPWMYRGYYFDHSTGLYYLQSRFYCPQVGRFLSMDDPRMLLTESFLAPNGANLFMYAYNNPVMFTDHNGYGPITTFLIGLGIAIAKGVATGAAVAGGTYVTAQLVTGFENWSWGWAGLGGALLWGGVAGGLGGGFAHVAHARNLALGWRIAGQMSISIGTYTAHTIHSGNQLTVMGVVWAAVGGLAAGGLTERSSFWVTLGVAHEQIKLDAFRGRFPFPDWLVRFG